MKKWQYVPLEKSGGPIFERALEQEDIEFFASQLSLNGKVSRRVSQKAICGATMWLSHWLEQQPHPSCYSFKEVLALLQCALRCTILLYIPPISAQGETEAEASWQASLALREHLHCVLEVPFGWRENLCRLVRWHTFGFHFLRIPDAEQLALRLSLFLPPYWVYGLGVAIAKLRGNEEMVWDSLRAFAHYLEEQGIWMEGPFLGGEERFRLFHPHWNLPQSWRSEVVMLAGLPGTGKDTWIQTYLPKWPRITLDDLREELHIPPTEPNQQPVVEEAKRRALELLLQGKSLVWNATNVVRSHRRNLIRLFVEQGAKVRLVYLEVPYSLLLQQNESRSRVVPLEAIQRMIQRWDLPDPTEVHTLEYWIRTAREEYVLAWY